MRKISLERLFIWSLVLGSVIKTKQNRMFSNVLMSLQRLQRPLQIKSVNDCSVWSAWDLRKLKKSAPPLLHTWQKIYQSVCILNVCLYVLSYTYNTDTVLRWLTDGLSNDRQYGYEKVRRVQLVSAAKENLGVLSIVYTCSPLYYKQSVNTCSYTLAVSCPNCVQRANYFL